VKKKLFLFLFLLCSLPIAMYLADQTLRMFGKASAKMANIVIDTTSEQNTLQPLWKAFAQGGEEPPPMLTLTIPKISALSPHYIRLDHIYDYYDIVKKNDQTYVYDFSKLDQTVDDIIKTGALPFFSLSYFPAILTNNGSVIDTPKDWSDWKNLVAATIEHYSGKTNKNLTGVYYEVWNEPELPQFGNWKLTPEKDYRLLYYYASLGSTTAKNVNQFSFGGPAVGSYYPAWVRNFVSYVEQNKLRLDFYSWHRYHKNPDIFSSDAAHIREILMETNHQTIPLIISEWGIDSENSTFNNSNIAASFTVSALSTMLKNVTYAFTFEIKDGPPPAGGKWGLLTHEKNQDPLAVKPRYNVFSALSKMQGKRLITQGEGTFVKGFASKTNDNTIQVILSNYDQTGNNIEQVPVTFTNLAPSSYTLHFTYPLTGTDTKQEIISTNGTIEQKFLLPANSVLYVELSASGPLAQFVPGKINQPNDSALVLQANDTLLFSAPEFRLRPQGKISFDIQPFWEQNDTKSFIVFDAPFSTESGSIQRLFLSKQRGTPDQLLTFGIGTNKDETIASIPISWEKDTWHHVDLGWSPTQLSLSVDSHASTLAASIDIRNGQILTFYPINAALDNLLITLGENQNIERQFDGRIDK
jgi:xylan 1,4-beta-xylosidase